MCSTPMFPMQLLQYLINLKLEQIIIFLTRLQLSNNAKIHLGAELLTGQKEHRGSFYTEILIAPTSWDLHQPWLQEFF